MTPEFDAPAVQFAPDPSLEGSGALLSDLGQAVVRRIVAANGWEVVGSKPVQLLYRPGRRLRIRHSVWARRGSAERRFSVTTELDRDPTGPPPPVPESVALETAYVQEGHRWRTWVYPFDPELPGLAQVLSIDGAREIAEPHFGRACSVRSSIVRYRPAKRAVVRFEVRPRGRTDGPPMVLFVKVLPPPAADTITRVAPVVATAGERWVLPTGRPRPDILVYPERAGTSLRSALIGSGQVPAAPAVMEVLSELASLPDPGTPGPADPARMLRRTVELLKIARPQRAGFLSRLAAAVDASLASHCIEPAVVHGDFYEGQLLVDDQGRVIGVLDVDDVGLGDPVMDVANYSAHLASLAESHPGSAPRLHAHRRSIRAEYLRGADAAEEALAAREVVAALGLATGPLRVLADGWPDRVDARIEIAARMMAGAGL